MSKSTYEEARDSILHLTPDQQIYLAIRCAQENAEVMGDTEAMPEEWKNWSQIWTQGGSLWNTWDTANVSKGLREMLRRDERDYTFGTYFMLRFSYDSMVFGCYDHKGHQVNYRSARAVELYSKTHDASSLIEESGKWNRPKQVSPDRDN